MSNIVILILMGAFVILFGPIYLFFGYKLSRPLLTISAFVIGISFGLFGFNTDLTYEFSFIFDNFVYTFVLSLYLALIAYLFNGFALVLSLSMLGFFIGSTIDSNLWQYSFANGSPPIFGSILGLILAIISIITKKTKLAIIVSSSIFGAICLANIAMEPLYQIYMHYNNEFSYLFDSQALEFLIYASLVVLLATIGMVFQTKKSSNTIAKQIYPTKTSARPKLALPKSFKAVDIKLHRFRWIIVILGIIVISIAAGMYDNFEAEQPSTLQFQIYEPTKLPANINIVKRYAESLIPTDASIESPAFNIEVSPDEFSIRQVKNMDSHGSIQSNTPVCPENNAMNINTQCTRLTTPNGQAYVVNKESYLDQNDKVSMYRVFFIKGETKIMIHVSTLYIPKYQDFNWGEYIDSFIPIDMPTDLEINRRLPL